MAMAAVAVGTATVAQAAGAAQAARATPPALPATPGTYTTEQAGALLGLSPDLLRENWQDEKLAGFRIGRTIRFPRWCIDAIVERRQAPVPDSAQAADPRVDVVLEAVRVMCRELARLVRARRRDATDHDAKRDLAEAHMALEECLDDLNALREA